ncbi:Crp/Fnr family transcriptional regulator [Thalassospira marina]|uniref:Crp/Fnr family transcriptional regulator n=1 Tax=Thalassospira marina TaxID=2048283 RepID=A0A2N3KSQ2_9PROT|nr:Crp/Fnr family transcriptional regulator [Thalassospira marina]AUG51359.1 Crp/Fnr family transcriptional regulator [Thalassospira marina]PKR53584.1 Crp/Fnr family transcriptional regulator [Thalassospira marina]
MNSFTTPPQFAKVASRILAGSFLFEDLDPALLEQLSESATIKRLADGDLLFEKGDPADGLYAVEAGKIRISSLSGSGKEIVLNVLAPGAVFGEIALLDSEPRTASARAVGPTRLLYISRENFFEIFDRETELRRHITALLCRRLRWVSALLEDANFLDLTARLIKRLLWLAERHGGPDPEGIRIALPLSQQELGYMLGVTREAVNKKLRELEKAGLITRRDGRLVIRDKDGLADLLANASKS